MTIRSINTSGLPQGVLTPMGDLLFAASEPGAWYDPSDLSTLFQDTAGTTPVTAVEQAVALMLDKSGRGNHASQATSTKRPKYSRRVNLLTNTGFSGAVAGTPGTPPTGWGFLANLGETVSVNADGSGGYVWRVKATSNRHFVSQSSAAITANSVWDLTVKLGFVSGVATIANLFTTNGVPSGASVVYYINNTAVAGSAAPVSGDTLTNRITTAGAGGTVTVRVGLGCSSNSTGEVEFSKLSLTLATDAHLPYQWVNTATDYDADPNKFPAYLACDGIDDAMQTGNIDFTGTDKMTVWAGVTATAGSPTGVIVESSGTFSTNNGAFALLGHSTLGFEFASRGTALSDTGFNSSPPASPSTVVASFDIGGSSVVRRVNSQQSAITANQGVGNYGNYPFYIGARGGNAIYLNGRIYSLIVRGAQSSLSQIEATENLIRQKMRLP